MAHELRVTVKATIKQGRLPAFKQLASELVSRVREKDEGTLAYDWMLDADEKTCVILETFASSEAFLDHMGHVSDLIARMPDVADVELAVFGNASPAVLDAARRMHASVYAPFLSL